MTWIRDSSGRLRWVYELGTSHNEQDQADNTSSESKILIGGHEFKAIKSTTLTKESTIGKRRLEDQSEIADHVVENPVILDYVIELFDVDSEYEFLEDLYKKKTPFSLVTHHGAFDNMILQKLSDVKGQDSTETTTANITVQQIRIGKSETVTISAAVQDGLGAVVAETQYPGSKTLQYTIRTDIRILPIKDSNETAKGYTDRIVPVVASAQVQGLVAAVNGRSS